MGAFVNYCVRRLVAAIITLLGVIAVLIFTFQVLPGDPARVIAGPMASTETVAKIRKEMGLERSAVTQYLHYLGHVLRDDLGISPRTRTPVLDEVAERLPYTAALALLGTLLGGAVLTEIIFSWPGIGRLLIESIQARDFPMVQGIVLILAAMFILINFITDVLYTVVDPRVRLY